MRTEACLFRNVKCGIATVIITAESCAASVDTPHPANTQVSVPLFSRNEGTLTRPLHVPALRGLPAESPAARGSRNPGVHERHASPGKRPLGNELHCPSSAASRASEHARPGQRPPRRDWRLSCSNCKLVSIQVPRGRKRNKHLRESVRSLAL